MTTDSRTKNTTLPPLDTFSGSLRKTGEELCGSLTEITREGGRVTAVLAAGAGDGIRANISATFVKHMVDSLLRRGCGVREAVGAVAQMLPRDKAAPGLAVLRLDGERGFSAASFHLPHLCCLRHGKLLAACYRPIEGAAPAEECAFPVKNGDAVILFDQGFLHAGDPARRTGWTRAEIESYLSASYRPAADARHIGSLLLNAANSLSFGRPQEDAALLVLRFGTVQAEPGFPRADARRRETPAAPKPASRGSFDPFPDTRCANGL